ncbi:UbiA family prenyltransferase [Halorussus marinus]|uniref:UbiA family prenyltransferase n=1 Tax=Halorussus marinus TaxID=2505976 RepID=UPI001FD6D808|nr:UbiA family prenyltransferase [Halorussus marinus]
MTRSDATGLRAAVGAYAELLRVPNLFTAPPDVVVGAALAAAAGATVPLGATAGLAVASALLYAGGTTLNDYFDAAVDAAERPERPIPSGRVSRAAALGVGLSLLGGGVAVAAAAGGARGGLVAAALAAAVVLYDAGLKGSAPGFLTMGSTRGLNVFLGTTAAGLAPSAAPAWLFAVPVVVAGYIAAVTSMAADEATGGDRRAVALAGAGAVAAGVAAPALVWAVGPGAVAVGASGLAAVGFLAWTGGALRAAYRDPTPETVGPAVGTCVLGLVALDAAFAAVAGAEWAAVALAFLLPAVGLSRAFDVS